MAALIVCLSVVASQPVGDRQSQGYPDVLATLLEQYPVPVNVSPNGKYLLTKTRGVDRFSLNVVDRRTGSLVASSSSPYTQLELTWSPDSKQIAYLSAGDRSANYRLFVWNLGSGKTSSPPLPPLYTAARPIYWSPNGSDLILATDDEPVGTLILVEEAAGDATWTPIGQLQPQSEYSFNPQGTQVAYACKVPANAVRIWCLATGTERRVVLGGPGVVRDVNWSADGKALLCTFRRSTREFVELYRIDLASSHSRRLEAMAGDIRHPRPVDGGKRIVFELEERGYVRVATCDAAGRDLRWWTPKNALARVVGVSSPAPDAYLLMSPAESPPELQHVRLDTKAREVLFRGGGRLRERFTTVPKPLTLERGGIPLHLYLWSPPTVRPQGAILVVHGGPHRHSAPKWDANFQLALERGFAVVLVNYRGSTGYGRSYERCENVHDQASDVLAAADYVSRCLDIPFQKQVFLAESSGCTIVLRALASSQRPMRSVVLIAPVAPGEPLPSQPPIFVSVYQGENDPVRHRLKIEEREAGFTSLIGVRKEDVHISLLCSEGHNPQRTSSWAQIFARLFEDASRNQG